MERSDERLSTRDIASPSGGETDAPPQRFEREDREDRDFQDAGAVSADRAEPVGDGDVVTDEPVEGRDTSRESTADPAPASTGGDDASMRADEPDARAAAPATAAAAAAMADTANADTTTTRADTDADADTATGAETRRDSATDGDAAPLLSDAGGFQARWEEIQVRFVDEPRGAVEDADALVATVMQRLAEGFAQERERLEAQWGRGEDISTEDLRVALQRYRSFFQRLLST
jgi:hypothetical protein